MVTDQYFEDAIKRLVISLTPLTDYSEMRA